ncbi:hypothetical protein [Methylomonas paludis]|nr:hypothetical protein [Methylomonas paludis]
MSINKNRLHQSGFPNIVFPDNQVEAFKATNLKILEALIRADVDIR